jgi:uncharacterized CHY-type Zn-finger protein
VTDDPPPADARDAVRVPLRGVDVDAETRCAHYDSDRDVVAIRFPCCDVFYPCAACHAAVADHPPERLPPAAFGEGAVSCGACGTVLAASTYLGVLGVDAGGEVPADAAREGADRRPGDGDAGGGASDPRCPACGAGFNPGCAGHVDRYFAVDAVGAGGAVDDRGGVGGGTRAGDPLRD